MDGRTDFKLRPRPLSGCERRIIIQTITPEEALIFGEHATNGLF